MRSSRTTAPAETAGRHQGAAEAAASRGSRALYASGLAGAATLALVHGSWLVGALQAWPAAIAGALLAAGLGVLAADLATGIVHWACDTYGDEGTPWLGPALVRWFREHHRAPAAMLRRDALDVNGQAACVATALLGVLALPPACDALAIRPAVHAFLVCLLGVSALGNQLHQWAHDPAPPRPVRWLQRRGLVLSRRSHARHHRPPHDRAYCTATGWMNAPLDALGFWRGLERAIASTTGAAPRSAERPVPAGGARMRRGTREDA